MPNGNGVIVKLAVAVFPPNEAVMVELPVDTLLANPEAAMLVTKADDADQLAVVIDFVVPSA